MALASSPRRFYFTMSLKLNLQGDLLNAAIMYGPLLDAAEPMRLFAEHIYPAFRDAEFKDCYAAKGRNGISPAFLSLVTILQWRESLSDVETAAACNFRIDWKIALHLRIEDTNLFEASTLCRFRRRLLEQEKASLMFDKILNLCIEKGFVRKRGRQRVDATHIVKHVNRISTTDLLFRSVKSLVEELERKFASIYEDRVPEDIKERYEKTFSSFGFSKQRRGDKQAELVQDGLMLEAIARECGISEELVQLPVMLTVFQENVIIRHKEVGEKIFIEAEEIPTPKQTIFDPKDPSLQLGMKGKTHWVGAKCQITETAGPKGTINFITGVIEEPAQKSDQKSHEALMAQNEKFGLEPEKVYADSNYISGQAIAKYRGKSQELMGYFAPPSGNKNGFGLANFSIRAEDYSAVCPAGKKSIRTTLQSDGRRNVYFSSADCQSCQFRHLCTESKTKRGKKLTLKKHHKEIAERRALQQTEEFRTEMKLRPAIEGTISELVRVHGLRKIRYKGQRGRQFQCYSAATALNVRRLLKAIAG
jgi:transposase